MSAELQPASASAANAFILWPDLANAKQPPPLERVGGSFSFNTKAEWANLVAQVEAGTFRLRAPAASPRGLCGPTYGQGDCLSPVFEGDVGYFDPTMTPEDGDFVLVLMDPRKARRIEEYVRANPRLLAMHGAGPHDLVFKQLRRLGNEWVLLCRDGISYLDDRARGEQHKILGVLRYVEAQGCPIYGCGPLVVHNIDPNAATFTYSATDTGPITKTVVGPATNAVHAVLTVSVTTIDSAEVIQVNASMRLGINETGGGSLVSANVAACRASSGVGLGSPRIEKTDNLYEPIAIVHTFTQAPGTYNVGIGVDLNSDGVGTIEAIFRDVNLQVTVIRR